MNESSKNRVTTISSRSTGKFFLWVGFLVILITGAMFMHRLINLSNFISTQAKIINSEKYTTVRNGGRGTYYRTTLQFNTKNGNSVQVLETFSPAVVIGNYVPIFYEEKNPENILVNYFSYLYSFYIIFGVIGFIALIFGFWLFRRKENK